MNDTELRDDNLNATEAWLGAIATRICAVILVLYALYFARSTAVPVVTALVIYMVLRPLVRQGKRFGIHPAVGSAGIIFGLLVALSLATNLVFELAPKTIAEAPSLIATIKEKLSFAIDKL